MDRKLKLAPPPETQVVVYMHERTGLGVQTAIDRRSDITEGQMVKIVGVAARGLANLTEVDYQDGDDPAALRSAIAKAIDRYMEMEPGDRNARKMAKLATPAWQGLKGGIVKATMREVVKRHTAHRKGDG